jgi:hypothetical protein
MTGHSSKGDRKLFDHKPGKIMLDSSWLARHLGDGKPEPEQR